MHCLMEIRLSRYHLFFISRYSVLGYHWGIIPFIEWCFWRYRVANKEWKWMFLSSGILFSIFRFSTALVSLSHCDSKRSVWKMFRDTWAGWLAGWRVQSINERDQVTDRHTHRLASYPGCAPGPACTWVRFSSRPPAARWLARQQATATDYRQTHRRTRHSRQVAALLARPEAADWGLRITSERFGYRRRTRHPRTVPTSTPATQEALAQLNILNIPLKSKILSKL